MDKKLGSGGFGAVKVGKWNGTDVAVKSIARDSHSSEIAFQNEVALLAELHHPNIVQMYGYSSNEDKFLMVLELVHGGDLQKLIHDKSKPQLSTPNIIDFVLNISRGMIYLHKRNILHRDMKPGNILVTNAEQGQVKITDFGLSKMDAPDLTKTAHFGTPLYAAPELVSDSYTDKVDVFSFAIIMWEMFAKELPYSSIRFASEVQERVRKGERPSPWPSHTPKHFQKLIARCWAGTPSKRPSFEEIHEEVEKFKKEPADHGSTSHGQVGNSVQPATAVSPAQHNLAATRAENPTTDTDHLATPNSDHSSLRKQTEHDTFIKAMSTQEITWTNITMCSRTILRATNMDLERIKYLFEANAHNNFISFVEHFTPLVPEVATQDSNIYETEQVYETGDTEPSLQEAATKEGPQELADGFRISEIAEVVSQPYFHGFLSAPEAKVVLDPTEKGTFIIRFSRDKKFYSLDVKDETQVRHWRIEKLSKFVLALPGHTFKNIPEIIKHYQQTPLQLQNGSSCCCLASFMPRKK